ncbi:hypothetical protein [Cytobacillus oceanisediminis]|uniref:hypothetical protein n=1 Tax=Cytobacillus oceanisediminis TaxID=665099 RepID=UPI001FB41B3D|nr:hypothetical protein [Cytobacillus oceanisediminis]UOE58166.1 hypothetical protein IRB79_27045 [Cytobacillus oceanisediminis]
MDFGKMDIKQALLLRYSILDEQAKILEQFVELEQKNAPVEPEPVQTKVKPETESEKVHQPSFFSKSTNHRGQISYAELSRLITDILKKHQVVTHTQLVKILFEEYGLKWKNFFDTLAGLKRGGYLFLDKFKRDGTTYYQLPN